jgi:hypothetical protein
MGVNNREESYGHQRSGNKRRFTIYLDPKNTNQKKRNETDYDYLKDLPYSRIVV